MLSFLATIGAVASIGGSASWQQVDSVNTFSDVAVTQELHDSIVQQGSAPFWGHTGPAAVLGAWTSSAYDAERQVMYFTGGGHADYGGNEIYSYDIKAKRWARLSDPAPLDKQEEHKQVPGTLVSMPSNSPISQHTYDGMVWNPGTNTLWISGSNAGFGGSGMPPHMPQEHAVWEFNPADASWKKHPASQEFTFPMSTYVKDTGQTLFVSHYRHSIHQAMLFNADGSETFLGDVQGLNASGISMMFTDPDTGNIYAGHHLSIYQIHFDDTRAWAEKVLEYPTLSELHFNPRFDQAAFSYRSADKKFYIWNGGSNLLRWDPASNEMEVIWEDAATGPSNNGKGVGRVFEKFVYLNDSDEFIGIQQDMTDSPSDGFWRWAPHENAPGLYQASAGPVEIDGVTQTSVSLFLPSNGSDKNFNSRVSVHYRQQGQTTWMEGPDLVRVRPEFVSNTKNGNHDTREGYATIVTGLAASRNYELRLQITDEDGVTGDATQTASVITAARPSTATQQTVTVSSTQELQNILRTVQPGTKVVLESGTYTGPFILRNSGTRQAPIVFSGENVGSVVVDGQGNSNGFEIQASHLVIENISFVNTRAAVNFLTSTSHVAITNNYMSNTDTGVNAKSGQSNLFIHNNVLEGKAEFGNVESSTWNYEGIVVTGESIEISGNTVSGFGDGIGMHWSTPIANKAINIHGNAILWGGDDGIEFDFTNRNVAVHENMISNVANGMSFQPVWGGPAYAFRNVILNTGRGPLKIKPEQDHPRGIHIYHNTFVRDDSAIRYGGSEAWSDSSGDIIGLRILNNLFVSGESQSGYVLWNSSRHQLVEMDYNGWTTDGKFSFNLYHQPWGVNVNSFEEWKNTSELGNHDQLFDPNTLFETFNADLSATSFADYRDPLTTSMALAATSPAIDKGLRLPGFNNTMTGAAPDLGAMEAGETQRQYGAGFDVELNNAPVAQDDVANTAFETEVDVFVLNNDSDPEGDALSVVDASTSVGGVHVQIVNDQYLRLSPGAGFSGEAAISYVVADELGNQVQAFVQLTVEEETIVVAPFNPDDVQIRDDYFSIQTGVLEFGDADLLANDDGVPADSSTIFLHYSGQIGQLLQQENGYVYIPNGAQGKTDVIFYVVMLPGGVTTNGTIYVAVN